MTDFFCPVCENVYELQSEAESCCHGAECDCEDCQIERACDTERERYADDGRDYADPGDFLRGYED